ncbi:MULTISPECIES: pseudouridine synthase [Xanthomonas]|uniref:pseudouridine synthase n=1 Tax=Xanthomonas TaxID=338 RepID=UPI0017808F46|nr:pseudouridine synthase [Xanthomonas surreyensis]MBD7922008.1 rRNA pseudouridine synthase [Xanthomonas surreyensis]
MPAASAPRSPRAAAAGEARHGLARTLSKLGLCSRTEAARWIAAGRVAVDGRTVTDPEFPILRGRHRLALDGLPLAATQRLYLMLNKPRGLVTTAQDERGRDTVYRCFDGAGLPWLAPVGRLDKASEGLLLFCNDPQWAARVADPASGPDKTYHVQVDALPDAALLARMCAGVVADGEPLRAKQVRLLRQGDKHAWLEVVLDEGRNRQIRRLLAELDLGVLRLVRVAIGGLALGELGKGAWRELSAAEVRALAPAADASAPAVR